MLTEKPIVAALVLAAGIAFCSSAACFAETAVPAANAKLEYDKNDNDTITRE